MPSNRLEKSIPQDEQKILLLLAMDCATRNGVITTIYELQNLLESVIGVRTSVSRLQQSRRVLFDQLHLSGEPDVIARYSGYAVHDCFAKKTSLRPFLAEHQTLSFLNPNFLLVNCRQFFQKSDESGELKNNMRIFFDNAILSNHAIVIKIEGSRGLGNSFYFFDPNFSSDDNFECFLKKITQFLESHLHEKSESFLLEECRNENILGNRSYATDRIAIAATLHIDRDGKLIFDDMHYSVVCRDVSASFDSHLANTEISSFDRVAYTYRSDGGVEKAISLSAEQIQAITAIEQNIDTKKILTVLCQEIAKKIDSEEEISVCRISLVTRSVMTKTCRKKHNPFIFFNAVSDFFDRFLKSEFLSDTTVSERNSVLQRNLHLLLSASEFLPVDLTLIDHPHCKKIKHKIIFLMQHFLKNAFDHARFFRCLLSRWRNL